MRIWSFVRLLVLAGLVTALCPAGPILASSTRPDTNYVRVSLRDAHYFELSDGRPYIPIGLNMVAPEYGTTVADMQSWITNLEANGGNYIRVFASIPYYDVEPVREGSYDAARAKRLQEMLAFAGQHGIRVNMCLEYFRHLHPGKPKWAQKSLYLVANGGTATNMADFVNGAASREEFQRKLAWYSKQFGDDPTVFGWQLWNEMNAIKGGNYIAWTRLMLPVLHRCFPRNLCTQSLGSYDGKWARRPYRIISTMRGNDVAFVHRYLDLGARLKVCKGPMDILAADAVRSVLKLNPGRPVFLEESGAVETNHSGPSKLYLVDTNGMLLHDVLFAPFFAGAAGPGATWYWNYYVNRQNLWWQYGRFAEAVKGIDPPAEHFQPMFFQTPRLRIYALKGRHTSLLWCRDSHNTWKTELVEGHPPQPVTDAVIDISRLDAFAQKNANVQYFDPWKNQWTKGRVQGGKLHLPVFKRSLVVKLSI